MIYKVNQTRDLKRAPKDLGSGTLSQKFIISIGIDGDNKGFEKTELLEYAYLNTDDDGTKLTKKNLVVSYFMSTNYPNS